MALEVPRALVEYILLGPPDDRRQLQDSPILGDVWIAFARQPDEALELLITPFKTKTARFVALAIEERLDRPDGDEDPNVAFLQGVIAAKLHFREILRVVVPMTDWWHKERTKEELAVFLDGKKRPEKLERTVDHIFDVAKRLKGGRVTAEKRRCSALERLVALAGVILWAADQPKGRASRKTAEAAFAEALSAARGKAISDLLTELFQDIQKVSSKEPLVFQISMNRTASSAIARSVLAVKGDAARTLFDVDCKDITWAVVDSGIDRIHPAFLDAAGNGSRVLKSFDFTQLRYIVSLGNTKQAVRKNNLGLLRKQRKETLPADADAILEQLANDAREGRGTNWELVEKIVVLERDVRPQSDHGTHVAGIIGASKTAAENALKLKNKLPLEGCQDGMCPDIGLYDFRVLGAEPQRHRVRDHRGAAVHPLSERPRQLHHHPRREPQPVDPARRAQLRLRPHAGLQRVRATDRERRRGGRRRRQPRLQELPDQGRLLRRLYGVQHHRSRQCRRRDHRRRRPTASGRTPTASASSRAAGRPATAAPSPIWSRRASASAPARGPTAANGAISTAPAWPRRTSAARRRCSWRATRS